MEKVKGEKRIEEIVSKMRKGNLDSDYEVSDEMKERAKEELGVKCSWPGCRDWTEYSVPGAEYCEEHFIIAEKGEHEVMKDIYEELETK